MKDDGVFWVLGGLGLLLLWSRSAPRATVGDLMTGGSRILPDGSVMRAAVLPVTEAPSQVGDETQRGNTNPISTLAGWVGSILRPQTTLPGNAPVSPALPAGPGGAISPAGGGNPGTVAPFVVATAPFYSQLYDTPGAYFDPVTGAFYPH